MGELFNTIRALVAEGRYVVGQHAAERLDERGALEWQVVDGIENGALMAEWPNANPNPRWRFGRCSPMGARSRRSGHI
jgi:hypothetical protein